jgi:exodeoxyribonuclease-3
MKLATWNVNSVRSRKELLLKWLKDDKPDVVLLQETKCIDEAFPKDEIEELGYNISIHGQKTYNGVAVLSLYPIDELITKLPGNPVPDEARYLEAVISLPNKAIRVISVYVPNGDGEDGTRFEIKLRFLDALRNHMKNLLKLDEIALIGGDFNVAPEEIDTYSPEANRDSVLFHIEVRRRLRAILNLGYSDSFRIHHPKESQFTWWDYRGASWYNNKGMRIDHILLSPEACDLLKDVKINSELRGSVNPSDHVPVICELNIF